MQRLVVLDFSTSSVNIYSLTPEDADKHPDDLLKELGHNTNNCSYMFCESLSINLKDY